MSAEEKAGICAGCHLAGPAREAAWCPVWNVYLCPACRWVRTEGELRHAPSGPVDLGFPAEEELLL